MSLGAGAVLEGRYRLAEKIGEGGMGAVFVAHDTKHDDREVAIKVLHKTLVADDAAIARFRNEARAASKIDHVNVCSVLDVGEFEGAPFLVMPRLVGENLGDRLARDHSLPPVKAAEIVLEVLAGLEVAHALGVLHRDLKPENIFLASEQDTTLAKIVDFGVAKFVGDDAERVKMTRTGALIGTPAYMSPEQALGDEVDVRSDVWASGVLLFEMLTGRLPFEAANYNAMLVKIATEPPPSIRTVLPALDESLASVVDKALARRRDDRFGSAREMASALRAWLAGAPLRLAVPRVAMPTPLFSTTPMSWAEQESGATHMRTLSGATTVPRRNSRLAPVVVSIVVAVGAIAIAVGMRRHTSTSPMKTAVAATVPVPRVHEAPHEFLLAVTGVPAAAHVKVDGVAATLPVRVPRGTSARIEITNEGFEPWAQTITPTGDVSLTYEPRALPQPTVVADAATVTNGDASNALPANAAGTTTHASSRRRGRQPLQGGVAPRPDF